MVKICPICKGDMVKIETGGAYYYKCIESGWCLVPVSNEKFASKLAKIRKAIE